MEWFQDIEAHNDDQTRVMQQLASAFEDWFVNRDDPTTYIRILRDSIDVDLTFQLSVMENAEIFEISYKVMCDMKLTMMPETRSNARYVYKVAHIVYPGDEFKDLRQKARASIKEFVKSESTKRRAQATNGGASSATPQNAQAAAAVNQPPPLNLTSAQTASPPPTASPLSADPNAQLQTMMMLMLQNMMQQQQTGAGVAGGVHPQPAAAVVAPPQPTPERAKPAAQAFLPTPRHADDRRARTGAEASEARRVDPGGPERNSPPSRVHHDIGQRFNRQDEKYGGSEGEDFQSSLRSTTPLLATTV